MGLWTYSRADRLSELLGRARTLETYLARERCDTARGTPARVEIDARLATVQARVKRLAERARVARHNARLETMHALRID